MHYPRKYFVVWTWSSFTVNNCSSVFSVFIYVPVNSYWVTKEKQSEKSADCSLLCKSKVRNGIWSRMNAICSFVPRFCVPRIYIFKGTRHFDRNYRLDWNTTQNKQNSYCNLIFRFILEIFRVNLTLKFSIFRNNYKYRGNLASTVFIKCWEIVLFYINFPKFD